MAKDGKRRSLPTGRVRRTAPLVGLTSRTAMGRVGAALRRRLGNDRALVEFHERAAQRYAASLGNARGALMKLGQVLSFVEPTGIIRPEFWGVYQEAFAGLRTSAEPMSSEIAMATVEAELGAPVETLFASFDPDPLAQASIGQVHRAMRLDGRAVAVKVQYPGVAAAIESDLANAELLVTMMKLGQRVSGRGPHFDARGVATELEARLREELDYTQERRNQEELAGIFADHPDIRIPAVHADLSSDRVLTMDLATGLTWDQALVASADLRDAWGFTINRFFFHPLYQHGLFHADPHPGNYLFHEDGTVTFLDFGCVKRMDAAALDDFVSISVAALDSDVQALAAGFRRAGFFDVENTEDQTVLDFYRPTFAPLTEPQPFRYTPEFVTSMMQALSPSGENSTIIQERFNLPPEFVFTTRTHVGLSSILGALGSCAYWRDEFESESRAYAARIAASAEG